MTDAELKRLIVASARTARRYNRRLQTQAEILERWLDRMIARKTRIRESEGLPVVAIWDTLKNYTKNLELTLADFLNATRT
jgi:hypothetical protein